MSRIRVGVLAGALALAVVATPAQAASQKQDHLDMYRAKVGAAKAAALVKQDVDVSAQKQLRTRQGPPRPRADARAAARTRGRRRAREADAREGRQDRPPVRRRAGGLGGYNVWRDYDGADGIAAYMRQLARDNPQLVKLEKIGETYQGRDILAIKLTQGARTPPTARVRRCSTARRSTRASGSPRRRTGACSPGTSRSWRANDKAIKHLLKDNELWFVLVCNPDGYQYTFDHERLWRKNLRDNNGDGQTSRSVTASTRTATTPSTSTTTRRARRASSPATPIAGRSPARSRRRRPRWA